MFTATINVNVSGQIGGSYSSQSSISAGLRKSIFEAIPAGTTELVFDLDVSEVKMLALRSDVAVTVKTNSASSPANTFSLAANESFLWPMGDGVFKDSLGASVSTDIAKLYVVNSGPAGTLRLDAFVDPTPAIVAPAAPVISSALTASGAVGSAFSYQIAASNTPSGFNAAGLPAGLSVNTSTGLISGTPSVDGDTTVTISATNAGGTGSASLVISVAL
jgi:hypothetical protein